MQVACLWRLRPPGQGDPSLVRQQRQVPFAPGAARVQFRSLSRRVTVSGAGRQGASSTFLDNGVVLVASATPNVYGLDITFCAIGVEPGKV